MLKLLFTTCLLAFAILTASYAQTLKITAVDASDTKTYNKAATECLGKFLSLAIYDNSAIVKFATENIALKQTSANNYSKVETDNEHENLTWYLVVDKTLGVITSITLKFNAYEKGGQHRSTALTITAKRF